MPDPIDLKEVSKYLHEYANIIQAEATRFVNMGFESDAKMFEKAETIKHLADTVMVHTWLSDEQIEKSGNKRFIL